MSYGLSWSTAVGSMALYSEGYGIAYLGTATYVGQYTPSGSDPHILSQYTISSTFAPLVFIELVSGVVSGVVSSVLTSTNTWTIIISSCTVATQLNVAPSQPTIQTPTLYCFAQLSGSGSTGYGLKMFDASGNLSWDSNRAMIIPKQLLIWPVQPQTNTGSLSSQTLSYPTGLSRPACSMGGYGWGQSTKANGSAAVQYQWSGAFTDNGSGSIKRTLIQTIASSEGGTPTVNLQTIYKSEANLIIDLADYL